MRHATFEVTTGTWKCSIPVRLLYLPSIVFLFVLLCPQARSQMTAGGGPCVFDPSSPGCKNAKPTTPNPPAQRNRALDEYNAIQRRLRENQQNMERAADELIRTLNDARNGAPIDTNSDTAGADDTSDANNSDTARKEDEARQAYEAAAQRAAEESARRAQGNYVRSIIESDVVDRENEDLSNAIEKQMRANNGSDLGALVESEMQKNASPADSVFGADAQDSIFQIDTSTSPTRSDSSQAAAYQPITPPPTSAWHDPFQTVREVATEAYTRAKQFVNGSDLEEKAINAGEDKLLEKLTPGPEEEPIETGDLASRLKDKVEEFVVDHLWDKGIERLQDEYARIKATRRGETSPDPIELQYYKVEAAAHPLTGFLPQLFRNAGNAPKALLDQGRNLVDKFCNILGMAFPGPYPSPEPQP